MDQCVLSSKAGIPPLFQKKRELGSVPDNQPSCVEALHTSLKPFLVWFSDGFWLFHNTANNLGTVCSLSSVYEIEISEST